MKIINNTQQQKNPYLGSYEALAACMGIKRNGFFCGDPLLKTARHIADRLPVNLAYSFKTGHEIYAHLNPKEQLGPECELVDELSKFILCA